MKKLLFTVDLEEFDGTKTKNECSEKGFKSLYEVIQKNKIRTTFFVTWTFAVKNQEIIKKLITDGHEVACHAYAHSDRYNQMSEKNAYEKISLAKKSLEKQFGIKVYGFRAPQMSYPSYKILKDVGFKYDSSLHPTFLPGFHNELSRSRKIEVINGLTILPISTVPFLRVPFSWIWFRNFILLYTKLCSLLCYLAEDYVNIYFHPWDFCELNEYKIDLGKENKIIEYLYVKNTGKKALIKLDKYFKWINKKRIKSMTIREYLKCK